MWFHVHRCPEFYPWVSWWFVDPRFLPSEHLMVDVTSFGNSAVGALFVCLVPKGGSVPSHPGTSGDTGSAAIESVRGARNVAIIVLLPQGHCTRVQELQMTTVLQENVRVFGGKCWVGPQAAACSGRWAGSKLVVDELTVLSPSFP